MQKMLWLVGLFCEDSCPVSPSGAASREWLDLDEALEWTTQAINGIDKARQQLMQWSWFFRSWQSEWGDAPVPIDDLLRWAKQSDMLKGYLEDGPGGPKTRLVRVLHELEAIELRGFGHYRIENSSGNGHLSYRLVKRDAARLRGEVCRA